MKPTVPERMTVVISGKKKVTFINHKEAEVVVNRYDVIGRVIGTTSFKGELVGRDQFGKKLRLKSPTGSILTFDLDKVNSITQEEN